MEGLFAGRIGELLQPYYPDPDDQMLERLAEYLRLLLRWNGRTNLTAVRDPEQIVRRHFGESLFGALLLPASETLLDLGSGAGFPGIPIQLARPKLQVTLAESQGRKAAFLHEVVRALELPTAVWGSRVEAMPSERRFDVVALRAVDRPEQALRSAMSRIRPEGWIAHWTTDTSNSEVTGAIPGSQNGIVHLFQPPMVPRGTSCDPSLPTLEASDTSD